MTYRYLEKLSYADYAFEAAGRTLEELFASAADALTGLMVEDLTSVRAIVRKTVRVSLDAGPIQEDLPELLREFLERLVYWKDVDQLFLRASKIQIHLAAPEHCREVIAELSGEAIDPARHALGTDVKAVTFHRLKVWKESGVWKAVVVVDT